MAFKEMDPDVIRELLKSHEDLLTSAAKKEEAFFRNVSCPICGSHTHQEVINSRRPFSPGSPLPNKILTCVCGADFDPQTGIILRAPVTDE